MQPPVIAALYAGLAALLFLFLTVNAALARKRAGLAFGEGGDAALTRAVRAQGNAAETMPMALLLIVLVEMLGAPGWVTHLFGLALLAGRACHAWHCLRAPDALVWRGLGMALTLSAIALAALGLVGHALRGLA